MKRSLLTAVVLAASLLVPVLGASAGPPSTDVVCPQDTNFFSGTARNLIVPDDGFCFVVDSTITRDLVMGDFSGVVVLNTSIGHDLVGGDESDIEAGLDTTIGHDLDAEGPAAGVHLERMTIGHDIVASMPRTVQTGRNGPDTPGGTVNVGHDVRIDGSPDDPFVFDGICNLNVGHDFSITNRSVTLGLGIGNICAGNGEPANTVGHDLIVTGNHALDGFFGPSALFVGDNNVGHDLVFSNNTAVPGGTLGVSGNLVGHDATCAANTPAVSVSSPNVAGHSNSCG